MGEKAQGNIRIRARPLGSVLAAVTLALGVDVLPFDCRAAEPPGRGLGSELRALLASGSDLSEAAMSRQTGTGLRLPEVVNQAAGPPRVMLWDELKPSPQLVPATTGIVTIGPTGTGR
jgi:hypothetical protein